MVGLIVRVVVLVLLVGLVVLVLVHDYRRGADELDATFQPRPPDDEPEASGRPRFFQGVCPTRRAAPHEIATGRPSRSCGG